MSSNAAVSSSSPVNTSGGGDSGPVSAPVNPVNPYAEVTRAEPVDGDDGLLAEAMSIARSGKSKSREQAPEAAPSKEEASAAAPAAEPESKGPSAADWAKFYQQQKETEGRASQLKEREARIEQFEKAGREGNIQESLKLLGYEDPIKFLEMVAKHGGQMSPEAREQSELRKEVAALRAEKEAEKQAAVQQQAQQRRQQAKQALKTEVESYVSGEGKGMVSVPGGADAVMAAMQAHYNATKAKTGRGEELSVKQAVAQVEKDWESGIQEFVKIPKFRELVAKYMNAAGGASLPAKPAASRSVAVPAAAAPREAPAQDKQSLLRGDKELNEAMQWFEQRKRARRSL